MALIVQKYGGTSVGSVARMKHVARRVLATQKQGHDVAVVVSAMSGETNRLLELTRQLHEDPNDREVDVIVSTETCSPVDTMTSTSRSFGSSWSWRVSSSRRFVSPDIADTTTAT